MNIKKLNEELKKITEEVEAYKEYEFFFTKLDDGTVVIDAEDYDRQYKEWNDEENGELMEDVIDIAKDEQIKDDIEELEGREVLYIDITDFEYDEDDASGSFTVGVEFETEE